MCAWVRVCVCRCAVVPEHALLLGGRYATLPWIAQCTAPLCPALHPWPAARTEPRGHWTGGESHRTESHRTALHRTARRALHAPIRRGGQPHAGSEAVHLLHTACILHAAPVESPLAAHSARRRMPVLAGRPFFRLLAGPRPCDCACVSFCACSRSGSPLRPIDTVTHSVQTNPVRSGMGGGGGVRSTDGPGCKLLGAGRQPFRLGSNGRWRRRIRATVTAR